MGISEIKSTAKDLLDDINIFIEDVQKNNTSIPITSYQRMMLLKERLTEYIEAEEGL